MAEPLGISGYVDIEDIKKSFETLDALLGKLGIDFSKTSRQATVALEDIEAASDKSIVQKAKDIVAVITNTREAASKALSKVSMKNATEETRTLKKELESINILLQQNAKEALSLSQRIHEQQKVVREAKAGVDLAVASGDSADYIERKKSAYERQKKDLEDLIEEEDRLVVSTEQLLADEEQISNQLQAQNQTVQKQVTMRAQITHAREALMQMIDQGKAGTKEFQDLAIHAGKLRTNLSMANAQMEYFANPARHLAAVKSGLQGVAGAASLVTGTIGLFNSNSEEMAEIQTRIQSLMGITMGLETTYNAIRKTSCLYIGIQEVQLWAAARAKEAEAAATVKATIAQKAYNLVAKANPYVLIATAMATLVAGVAAYVVGMNKKKKAEEEAKKSAEELKKAQEDWAKSVSNSASALIVKYDKLKEEWGKLSDSQEKKSKFLKDNKKAFNELGYSVDTVTAAENFFINNTDDVVAAIMARAEAAAYESVITEQLKKKIEKQSTIQRKKDEYVPYASGQKVANPVGLNFRTDYSGWGLLSDFTLTKSGARKLNEQAAQNFEKEWKEAEDEYEKGVKPIQELMQKSLERQKSANSGLQQAGIKEYNAEDEKDLENYKKIQEEKIRLQEQLSQKMNEIESGNQKMQIDLMKDGLDKRLALLEYNFQKEYKEIEDQRKELEKSQGRALTSEENGAFDQREELLRKQYENNVEKEIKDEIKLREEAMDDYLAEYGTYEEKRLAVASKYARKIEAAKTEGEKMALQKEEAESLRQLSFEKLKEDIDWEAIFGDLKNVPVEVLDDVNSKLKKFKEEVKDLNPEDMKTLIEAMNSIESRVNVTSGFNGIREAVANRRAAQTNFNEAVKVYNYAKNDPEAEAWIVEEAYKRMIKAGKELSNAKKKEDDVWEDSIETATNYAKAISEVGKAIGGATGECLELAASAVMAGIGMADGIKAFGKAASAMERSVAVLAIIQAALQAVQAITSLFGGKEDTTLKSYVSAMDNYLNMLKSDIDKLKQAMDDSKNSMAETIQLYKDYLELQKQNSQAIKNQSRIWLNSGASGSSHSEGYKIADDIRDGLKSKSAQVKSFFQGAYNDLKTFYYQATHTVLSSTDQLGRMEWIWNLSDDTLKQLSQNYNVMSILGDKLSGAILSYVESLETVADSEDELFANLLDVDFDGFYSDFEEMISDMEVTSEEFADDFGEQLRKSLIKNMVARNYKLSLEDLYKKAAEYAREGTLENNISDLKDEYQRLADNAREEVEAINKITGFKSATSNDKSATYNSLEKFTYDQADDLIARVTAIQIIGEHQYDKLASMAEGQNIIVEEVRLVGGNVKNIDSNVTALVDIQQQSLGHLERINRNTSVLPTMADDMVKIKKMIENQ